MSKNNLTRVCPSCGLEKPLSAFLQITGRQGTTYGTLCASCRSMGMKEKASATPDDERTGTSSGMRIGAKERLEIEKKQKLDLTERQQRQEKEIKKREQIQVNELDRLEEKEKIERFHRETYIEEKKKQSFLNYQSKQNPIRTQSVLGQKKDELRQFNQQKESDEKLQKVEALKLEDKAKEELKKTTLDLSAGGPILTLADNVVSRDNEIFRQFQEWLGDSAPITKPVSKLYRQNLAMSAKQVQDKKSQQEKITNETPEEFVERNWGRKP